MQGFKLITSDNNIVRFKFYTEEAPVTCSAFINLLPFNRTFMHARTSGQEIWIDDAPELDIIQENASVFTHPGEVVYGPLNPKRAKTSTAWVYIMARVKALTLVIFLLRFLMKTWFFLNRLEIISG